MSDIKQEMPDAFGGGIQISKNQIEGENSDIQNNQQNNSPRPGDDLAVIMKQANGQLKNEPSELARLQDHQAPNNDWTPPGDRLAIDESPASGDIVNDADSLNDHDLNQIGTSASDSVDLPQSENANNLWTLPIDKELCTLDEIRRGQVINKVATNECPVPGCGKKINDLKTDPSPGTIASGLRTHVIFVHYANIHRKEGRKRRLGWRNKRSTLPALRKQFAANEQIDSPTYSDHDVDVEPENYSISNFLPAGLNLIQKGFTQQSSKPANKRLKQSGGLKPVQPESLNSLMKATSGSLTVTGLRKSDNRQNNNQNKNDNSNALAKNFSQQTSSLFSILAGLTQQTRPFTSQDNQNLLSQQHQPSVSKNAEPAHGNHSIDINQCNNSSNNLPVNSSLLTLLNEKFNGGLASSLQSNSNKSFPEPNPPRGASSLSCSNNRQNGTSLTNLQNTMANIETLNFNNNVVNTTNGDTQLTSYDNSIPLNSFIELIAIRTGCNIGPAGIAEAKKIIERFTTSIICSSQTIADHYVAPFSTEVIQQKPEIGPSDVMLAYKMMQKTQQS